MPTRWWGSPKEPEREPGSGASAGSGPHERVPADDRAADRPPDAATLHAFVLEIGRALSLAGTAVNETQDRLVQIAAANGIKDARIVVLPTTLIVALGPDRRATVEVIP